MRWVHKWREGIKSGQYYDLLRRGFLDDKPDDIEPGVEGLEFYLDAFQELGTCRPGGLDIQPIPFTAIVECSKIWDVDDFEEFNYIIRRMDEAYLSLPRGGQKAEGKKSASTNTNKRDPNKG